jgi:hypothetical protein
MKASGDVSKGKVYGHVQKAHSPVVNVGEQIGLCCTKIDSCLDIKQLLLTLFAWRS